MAPPRPPVARAGPVSRHAPLAAPSQNGSLRSSFETDAPHLPLRLLCPLGVVGGIIGKASARGRAGGAGGRRILYTLVRRARTAPLHPPPPPLTTPPPPLCPAPRRPARTQRGENVKRIRQETGAEVAVEDHVPGSEERVVSVLGERYARAGVERGGGGEQGVGRGEVGDGAVGSPPPALALLTTTPRLPPHTYTPRTHARTAR